MVYPTNAFDSRLQGDQVPLGSSPTKSQKKKKKKRYRTCCSLRTSLQLQLHHDQHQGLRCVRCYARRLGDSRRNAHAKAQAALEPGLRQTSHAIVWPLRPPFLSFSLPPSQGQGLLGDRPRLLILVDRLTNQHSTKDFRFSFFSFFFSFCSKRKSISTMIVAE